MPRVFVRLDSALGLTMAERESYLDRLAALLPSCELVPIRRNWPSSLSIVAPAAIRDNAGRAAVAAYAATILESIA